MLEMLMFVAGLILAFFLGLGWVLGYAVGVVGLVFSFFVLSYEFEWWHLGFIGVGWDLFSVGMIFLSVWLILMMIMCGVGVKMGVGLIVLNGVIMINLVLVFCSMEFLVFYLMFEAVLIPTFVLILGWGYQPERLMAGMYMMFYTVFCSLPVLVLILFYSGAGVSLVMYMIEVAEVGLFSVVGLAAFLVSVPVYGLHLWLPKAHVEAPVTGSMILAGVLLKLGGYGLVRYFFVFYGSIWLWSNYLIVLGLLGGAYVSLVCVRQFDLSMIIAYSSVVHMGLMLCGLFSFVMSGWMGGYILMVGHGLCSAGLFYYSAVVYERVSSRSVVVNSGLMLVYPSSLMVWFFLVAGNMSFPPSLNLFGEIYLIGSVLGLASVMVGLIFVMLVFCGVYCLFMFSWVKHGAVVDFFSWGSDVVVKEYVVCFMHLIPLYLFFLSGEVFWV